jgi:hypothetical protein
VRGQDAAFLVVKADTEQQTVDLVRAYGLPRQLQAVPISDLLSGRGVLPRPESFLDRIGALKQNGIEGGDPEQREAEGLGVCGHSDAEVNR